MLSINWNLDDQVARGIAGYNKLLLAYSGGLDSTVLLDILTKLRNKNRLELSFKLTLRAIYIHHGISKNADMWADHCAQQCKIRQVPFCIIYIDCLKKADDSARNNLEAIARNLRYEKLFYCLHKGEILLTAHHMDDQVETLFLALKRGSGPAGLAGMIKQTMNNKYQHQLLRPLLESSRSQLEMYARKKQLIWIEDETNTNIQFDRNFLRKEVLPLLSQRWPHFNIVASRSSQLCRDQENLLKELLSEYLNKLIDSDGFLFFNPLLQFSILKRRSLLRYWLANFITNMPSYQLLQRIWNEVILSKPDANPILKLDKYVILRRYHKKLYVLPKEMEFSFNKKRLNWFTSIDHKISLPCNLGLLIYQPIICKNDSTNYEFITYTYKNNLLNIFNSFFKRSGSVLTYCFVRAPKINEKISINFGNIDGLFYIVNRNRGRCLKKIWQELNIPPWLRSRIPLLFYNDVLITAIGVFITQDGVIRNNKETPWNISWIQDTLYYKIFRNSIHRYIK